MTDPSERETIASTTSPGERAPVDPSITAGNASERYRVGRELARGGMGSIHEAQDLRLSRTVAVKRLLLHGADAKARFEREALITAHLQHPAVVPIFDFGELPAQGPYYAMKLVEGESLDHAMRRARSLEARLALLPSLVTVVEAVAYAHGRGIVHRDLKPSNVLVGAFGETVVIDWGLAKDLGSSEAPLVTHGSPTDASLTRVGTVIGTPAYMAPEQTDGAGVDARADVYALGAMLYQLLSGGPPYSGMSAASLLTELRARPPVPLLRAAPGLPDDLVTIVEKAMARKPSDRYQSALEMSVDLRRFQTGRLVGAHHYTAWQLARRLVGKNPLAVALGAVVAIAVVFAIAVFVVRQTHVRDLRETQRLADIEIRTLEMAMGEQHDPAELRRLAPLLEDAVRRARRAGEELDGSGAPVVRADDETDLRIHAVLARLDGDTYSIPPRFRRAVVERLDQMSRAGTHQIRQRKSTLWPIITRELGTFGLPEELGYVAWQESFMDPSAEGNLGARGLWQFTPELARAYGLRVDAVSDERTDPVKSSRAAAHHLADLFAEFGGDATLMAIVSYTLGEPKMRALLREIAMEKGSWRSGQRSYWHLYRMRRLPPDAARYVPDLVAVALLDRSAP